MTLRSLIVMAGLLVFLAIRSRRNPLFLAGGAAFLTLGHSMYIDISPGQALLAVSTFVVTGGDLLFGAVALGWLYARLRRPVPCARLSRIWALLGTLVASFLALEFVLAWASATELHPALMLSTRIWFYVPVGYLLTLDVLRRFTIDETRQYMGVLSLLTVLLSALYILSALGLPIYPYGKYLVTSFRGGTIIRDLSTFPFWAGLAWCFYLSLSKKSAWTYAAMAVLACAVLPTYSRSEIALLAVTGALAVILLLLGARQLNRALVVGVACMGIALLILVVAPVAVPRQFAYLQRRFAGTPSSQNMIGMIGDPTTHTRITDFEKARASGARVDPYLGAGLFDSSPGVNGDAFLSPDSDWIGIVYRTGLVGILVFSLPLTVALWRGVRRLVARQSSSATAELLLTGFLATVWYTGWRFGSAIYLWWPAVSLLSVALIARAEASPTLAPAATHHDEESQRTTSGGATC